MEVTYNNKVIFYDDTYSKKFKKWFSLKKKIFIVLLMINLINESLYILSIHNEMSVIFIVPWVFAAFSFFIYIKEMFDRTNQNNGDNIYIKNNYYDKWNEIYFPYYSQRSLRIFLNFISNEDNRKDFVINDMYERMLLDKSILKINPGFTVFLIWFFNIFLVIMKNI